MSKIYRFRIGADQRIVRAKTLDMAKQIAARVFGWHNVKASVISWFPSHCAPMLTGAKAYDAWANAMPQHASKSAELRAMQAARADKLRGFYRPDDTTRIKAKAENLARKALAILSSM